MHSEAPRSRLHGRVALGVAAILALDVVHIGCYSRPGAGTHTGEETSGSTGQDGSSGSATGSATTSATSQPESSDSSPSDSSAGEVSGTSESTGGPVSCHGAPTPFGEPLELIELSSPENDDRAWLSRDELTVYFSSNRSGGAGLTDIYIATRESTDDPFNESQPLAGLSGPADEKHPAVTDDGLTIYLTREDPSVDTSLDIHVASRANVAAEFGAPERVSGINDTAANDQGPWISFDGTALYFYSQRTGSHDLYRTEAQPNGAWGMPVALGETTTDSAEAFPVLSDDGLTIFFASNRPGSVGGNDIWISTRIAPDDGFGAPTNVGELNSPGDDSPSWLSVDECRLYFVRSSAPSSADHDIWVAARTP